ncbi:MAG: DnaJ domain-containing protein [Alphaproteobacteria bacterium]|nr:DnaJ domain-containing protein [Alphaproteobacteria bacterium]
MLYLLGGFAVLSGFLLLVYLFVNADPARLARGLKVTAVIIAVVAVATLAISGRLAVLLAPLAMLMPLLIRVRSLLDRYRPPAGGQTSTVATAFLRISLDHDTGSMEGTVLRGRFAGMRLEELGPGDLLALLRECRAEDEEGARLLEAYLDRVRPDWRDELAGERPGGAGAGGARSASGDMSVDEAYAILGLSPGADEEAIKEAHRRLMVKLHPDHGGSDYLATKINRARDVLLHR